MQLKPKPPSVRPGLIAASCILLAATGVRAQDLATPAAEAEGGNGQIDWLFDSALAYYHENGRIQAVEPIINISKDDGNGEVINYNLTFDSLSGSSPNGALTSNNPQTFAGPSGKTLSPAPQTYTTSSGQSVFEKASVYSTAPGQLPVDPSYRDQRLALAGSWQLPLSRVTRWSVGGKSSFEHDFLSLTANASIEHDFNEKNTTVLFGINDESDSLHPIGGAPVPYSDYALFEKTGHESKNDVGVLLGVTQIMNRQWLVQLNASADRFNGYLNDPYKIMSVIDSAGNTTGYLYERRPNERMRRSLYLENRVGWQRMSAALSLRYMTDDWQIHSDTAQVRVRWWNSGLTQYWEPTVRWYQQSAADFYQPWISDTAAPRLTHASADSRLGAFQALTFGLKYGIKLDEELDQPGSEFSVRLEYYQQTMQDKRPAPGALQGLNLYPGLKSILLQFGFSY